MKSIIVVGEQGCGKTLHAQAFARHYQLPNISDGTLPKPVPKEDWLILVQPDQIDVSITHVRTVSFNQALREAGLNTVRVLR